MTTREQPLLSLVDGAITVALAYDHASKALTGVHVRHTLAGTGDVWLRLVDQRSAASVAAPFVVRHGAGDAVVAVPSGLGISVEPPTPVSRGGPVQTVAGKGLSIETRWPA